MTIHLTDITEDNFRDAVKLELHKDQENFVASNVYTIAQSKFMPEAKIVGIMNDDEMVGMVAYFLTVDFPEAPEDTAFIMRFMIGKDHQGKGYGRDAIKEIVNTIKKESPNLKALNLTVIPENSGAKTFYEKSGFSATGRQLFKEDEYSLPL